MGNNTQAISAFQLLTRSAPERPLSHRRTPSDAELILKISEKERDDRCLGFLSAVGSLLRLMDRYLTGVERPESFVEKFSTNWLEIVDWDCDPVLDEKFDDLNRFYSDIQLFCAVSADRQEEPLLFGHEGLEALTRDAYESLKDALWKGLVGSGQRTT